MNDREQLVLMRTMIKIFLVTLLVLSLPACNRSADNAYEGVVFRYAIGGPIASLDPAHATPPTARMLVGSIYDTLYRYQYLARPYQLTLGLAADFPQIADDGLSYIIPIRRGVLFHADPSIADPSIADREVTADDVIYSLLRHFDPAVDGQGAWLWNRHIVGVNDWRNAGADYDQPPAGLQALDRYTIKIMLSAAYGDFLQTLALPVASIVSRSAIEYYAEKYPLNPVGSGPFRLLKFTTGKLTLIANPDYLSEPIELTQLGYQTQAHQRFGLQQLAGKQLPLVSVIEVLFIRDAEQRWQALLDARVDGMQLPAMLYERVLSGVQPVTLQQPFDQQLHLSRQPLAQLYKIDFNMDDIRLGQAASESQDNYNHSLRCRLNQAFDWHAYNDEFFDGLGYVYSGVLPPVISQQVPVYHSNHQAEALFSDFEYLPQIEFGYSESRLNQQIFKLFQQSLIAAGYPEKLLMAKPFDGFSAFAKAYTERLLPLVHTGWALDYPGALNILQLYAGENSSPGPGVANYDSAEFDQLYARAFRTLDAASRQTLINQMHGLLTRDCVSIAGFSPAQIHVWRQAFVIYPDSEFAAGDLLRYAMPAKESKPTAASGKQQP